MCTTYHFSFLPLFRSNRLWWQKWFVINGGFVTHLYPRSLTRPIDSSACGPLCVLALSLRLPAAEPGLPFAGGHVYTHPHNRKKETHLRRRRAILCLFLGLFGQPVAAEPSMNTSENDTLLSWYSEHVSRQRSCTWTPQWTSSISCD